MVKEAVHTRAQQLWIKEVNSQPSLRTYRLINTQLQLQLQDYLCQPELSKDDVRGRIQMTKLRVGNNNLKISQGRISRTPIEHRLCVNCDNLMDEVEDEQHVLQKCSVFKDQRQVLFRQVSNVSQGAIDLCVFSDASVLCLLLGVWPKEVQDGLDHRPRSSRNMAKKDIKRQVMRQVKWFVGRVMRRHRVLDEQMKQRRVEVVFVGFDSHPHLSRLLLQVALVPVAQLSVDEELMLMMGSQQ